MAGETSANVPCFFSIGDEFSVRVMIDGVSFPLSSVLFEGAKGPPGVASVPWDPRWVGKLVWLAGITNTKIDMQPVVCKSPPGFRVCWQTNGLHAVSEEANAPTLAKAKAVACFQVIKHLEEGLLRALLLKGATTAGPAEVGRPYDPTKAWVCCACGCDNASGCSVCTCCMTDVTDHISVAVTVTKRGDVEVFTPHYGDRAPRKRSGTPKKVRVRSKSRSKSRSRSRSRNGRKKGQRRPRKQANRQKGRAKNTAPATAKEMASIADGFKFRPKPAKGELVTRYDQRTVKAIMAIVNAMCNPRGSYPGRLLGDWQPIATAWLPPWARLNAPFVNGDPTAAATDPVYLPDNQLFVVSTPSIVCSYIYYSPAEINATYTFYFNIPGEGTAVSYPVAIWGTSNFEQSINLPFAYLQGDSPNSSGPIIAMATDTRGSDKRYFWIQTGDVVEFTWLESQNFTITFWGWKFNAEMVLDVFECVGAGAGSYTATACVYMRISIGPSANGVGAGPEREINNLAFSVSFESGGRYIQSFAPSVFPIIGSLSNSKTVGGSLLVTNGTNTLFQNGFARMVQLPNNDHWLNYAGLDQLQHHNSITVGGAGYDKVGGVERSCQMTLEKGTYMWRKPNTQTWTEWRDDFTCGGGYLLDTHFPLTDNAYQIWVCNVQNTTAQPQTMVFTFASSYEANTTDTTREQEEAEGNSLAMVQLQDILRDMVQYSENPTHWGTILSNIESVVGSVAKYAPLAMEVLGAII